MRTDIADLNFTKVASGVKDDVIPFLKEKAQDFRRNAEPIAEEMAKSVMINIRKKLKGE